MSAAPPTAEWLTSLNEDDAMDAILDWVDDELHAGHDAQAWPRIGEWLRDLDPAALSVALALCVLMEVRPVNTEAWAREWGGRVRAHFIAIGEERVDTLLAPFVLA